MSVEIVTGSTGGSFRSDPFPMCSYRDFGTVAQLTAGAPTNVIANERNRLLH